MCGIAGFAGIRGDRESLVRSLGFGIDGRGGHAAGYVAWSDHGGVVEGRKLGYWTGASRRFVAAAASGPHCLMHARYATVGDRRDVRNAHPFRIARENGTVIWGAHNGMAPGASGMARVFGRPYTVDSKEIFELLADGREDLIGDVDGYGVLAWIERGIDGVFLARASDCGALVVTELDGGGIVWGSTSAIVYGALADADMLPSREYVIETGRVYLADWAGIQETDRPEIRFEDFWGGRRDVPDLNDPFFVDSNVAWTEGVEW